MQPPSRECPFAGDRPDTPPAACPPAHSSLRLGTGLCAAIAVLALPPVLLAASGPATAAIAAAGLPLAAAIALGWRNHRLARRFRRVPDGRRDALPARMPVHGMLRTFRDIGLRRTAQPRDIDLERMRRYGDIYLMFMGTLPIVVVTTSALAETLSADLEVFAKSDPRELHMPFYYRWVGNSNVVLANGQAWRRIRRITHPPLNAVHHFAPVFHRKALRLCEALQSLLPTDDAADLPLRRWLKAISLDSAGEALFGFDFKHLQQVRNPGIDALDYILSQVFSPMRRMLPLINTLPLPSNRRLQQAMDHLDTLVLDMIRSTRQQPGGSGRGNVLELLLREKAQDALSDEELRNNIIAMVLASHETTQVALGGVLYHLARYPQWQARIREESQRRFPDLETAFGRPGLREDGSHSTAFKHLQSFHELSRFILESMRVYSPLAHQNPRTATRATELGGYRIPAGTLISINIHAIHMHPQVWEQPQRFDPQRFSDSSLQFSHAYQPFGSGPRICAGRLFSLMEQQIAVCHLLRRFEIELPAPGYTVPMERGSFTGMHDRRFRLRFRRRPLALAGT